MSKNNKKQQKTTKYGHPETLRSVDSALQEYSYRDPHPPPVRTTGAPKAPMGAVWGTQEDLQEDQEEVLRPVIRS